MLRKQKAFTIVETLTTLGIIALLAVLTVCNTINSAEMKQKRAKAASKVFYTDAEYAYQNVLTYDTNGLNITKLKGADEYDITEDSAKLEELFEKYMDIVETPCSNIPNNSYTSQYIKREMKCADSVRGFNVGFYLDRQCSSIYNTKDYYQDDATMKYVENACGYIIYSAKKGLGKIGTDFFIIGLGKRGVK